MTDPTYDPESTRECRDCGHPVAHNEKTEYSAVGDGCPLANGDEPCECTEHDRVEADLRWELEQAREKNRELNRRAQEAESLVADVKIQLIERLGIHWDARNADGMSFADELRTVLESGNVYTHNLEREIERLRDQVRWRKTSEELPPITETDWIEISKHFATNIFMCVSAEHQQRLVDRGWTHWRPWHGPEEES